MSEEDHRPVAQSIHSPSCPFNAKHTSEMHGTVTYPWLWSRTDKVCIYHYSIHRLSVNIYTVVPTLHPTSRGSTCNVEFME